MTKKLLAFIIGCATIGATILGLVLIIQKRISKEYVAGFTDGRMDGYKDGWDTMKGLVEDEKEFEHWKKYDE